MYGPRRPDKEEELEDSSVSSSAESSDGSYSEGNALPTGFGFFALGDWLLILKYFT